MKKIILILISVIGWIGLSAQTVTPFTTDTIKQKIKGNVKREYNYGDTFKVETNKGTYGINENINIPQGKEFKIRNVSIGNWAKDSSAYVKKNRVLTPSDTISKIITDSKLGRPSSDGQVLSSTTLGVKSWITAPTPRQSFNGNRTVTRSGIPNINVGGNTDSLFLENYFFPPTLPICNISVDLTGDYPSNILEIQGVHYDDPFWQNINWYVTRPVSCPIITGIIVKGISKTIDNPFNENHTQYSVAYPYNFYPIPKNKDTTISIIVNTTSNQSISYLNIYWRYFRYFGVYSTDSIPIPNYNSFISNHNILLLSKEFSVNNLCAKNFGSISCSNQYYVYAVPHSWCGSVSFTINTFPTDFIKVWDNVLLNTDSSADVYIDVYVSPNKYNGTITVTAQ